MNSWIIWKFPSYQKISNMNLKTKNLFRTNWSSQRTSKYQNKKILKKSGLTRRIISRLKARWIKRGVLCCAGVSITLLELVLEPAPSPRIVFTSVGALKKCTRIDDKLRRIDDTSPFSALLGGDLWLRELIEKTCQSVKGRYTTYSHTYYYDHTFNAHCCTFYQAFLYTQNQQPAP